MLWAVVCMCYFGCTRAGEITAPERGSFDPRAHLTFKDVMVDNADKPRMITVTIKVSKMDQFREGVDIHLGWTGQKLCPVAAVLAYLVRRKEGPGPLFRFEDGRPLTRTRLVQEVRAATTAAEHGVEDSAIKVLGRWRSNTYQRYIRRDRANLAGLAEKLAGGNPEVQEGHS